MTAFKLDTPSKLHRLNFSCHRQRGVALLMVLSILSLLLLLAVSFTYMMRIELLASGTFLRGTQIQNQVHTAASDFLEELERNLRGDAMPYNKWAKQGSHMQDDYGGRIWYSTGSGNHEEYVFKRLKESMKLPFDDDKEEYKDYVPTDLVPYINEVLSGNPANNYPGLGWHTTDLVSGEKMAFIAYDCTLLDVNHHYTNSYIVDLPDVKSRSELKSLIESDLKGRAESYSELSAAKRNHSIFNKYTDPVNNVDLGNRPTRLFPFNREIIGEYFDVAGAGSQAIVKQYDISQTAGELRADSIDLQAILKLPELNMVDNFAGMPVWEIAYNALLDYVDLNWTPENQIVCGESVPMINEIAIEASYDSAASDGGDPATYTHTFNVKLDLETAFPFPYATDRPTSPKANFIVSFDLIETGTDGGGTLTGDKNAEITDEAPGMQCNDGNGNNWGYTVFDNGNGDTITFSGGKNMSPDTLTLVAKIQTLQVNSADGLLDDVAYHEERLDFNNGPGPTSKQAVHFQARDARFNQSLGDSAQYVRTEDKSKWTREAINEVTKAAMAPTANPGNDGGHMVGGNVVVDVMYSPNRQLEKVGELGFIPIRPHQTIRLYKENPNSTRFSNVYRNFVIGKVRSVYNRVNVNIKYPEIVSLPMTGIDFRLVPRPELIGSFDAVTSSEASELADLIVNSAHGGSGNFDNTCELLDEYDLLGKGGMDDTVLNSYTGHKHDWMYESVVRDIMPLYGTRGNVISAWVVLEKDASDALHMVIWRDAWPSDNGKHSLYVRSVRHVD